MTTDPFTRKRLLQEFEKEHSFEKVLLEMAREFGGRFSHAEQSGIPRDIAFEVTKRHFAVVAKAMDHIAKNVTFEQVQAKTQQSQNSEHKTSVVQKPDEKTP